MVRGTKLSGWKTEYPSTAPAYPTEMEHMLYFKNKKKKKKNQNATKQQQQQQNKQTHITNHQAIRHVEHGN